MRPSDQPWFILAVSMLAILALCLLARCPAQPTALQVQAEPAPQRVSMHYQVEPDLELPDIAEIALDLPDRCDVLVVRETEGVPRLGKRRPSWLPREDARREHQRELKQLIRVVAEEMGADALASEMIWRKAIYESSGHAGNVHIRSKDIEANRSAARKGRKRATERWRRARVPVHREAKRGLVKVGEHDAWALGRGLYGMVTGLHAWRWSTDAAPWSLCDPVVATVTIIWSMRAGLDECHGATLRDAYRRFSSGKCAQREDRLERRFDHLARGHVRGLSLPRFDPDAPADLGDAWPQDTADRGALYRAIHDRRGTS